MPMSAKPRENLPSPLSENFCQKARKKRATTFVTRALKRGSTAQSACSGCLCQASGDLATTCLPSRLSRVRAPSPALTSTIIPLESPSQADSQASTISKCINNVVEIRTFDL